MFSGNDPEGVFCGPGYVEILDFLVGPSAIPIMLEIFQKSLGIFLLMIFIISRTGAFGGNHAGTDGVVGTANLSKERTVQRGFDPT